MKRSTSASKLVHALIVRPTIPPPATPLHEWCNAISMIVPTLVALWYISQPSHSSEILPRIQCLGTMIHFPFSFVWHASCALGQPLEWLKRLDISFIHITGVFISFSVSGSVNWAAVNLLWTSYSILMCWTSRKGELEGGQKASRSQRIIVTVFLYSLPILFNGFPLVYLAAIFSFTISGTFYQVYPHGFGHSLFHVLMGIFQWVMIYASHITEARYGSRYNLQFFEFLKQF